MPQPRRGVRRYQGNDRAIALPAVEQKPPTPNDELPGEKIHWAPSPPREVSNKPIKVKRTCPEPGCQQLVKYNEIKGYFHSHNLPNSTKACRMSGK